MTKVNEPNGSSTVGEENTGGDYQSHAGKMLAAVMGLALLLRVVALLRLKQSLYFDYLLIDEKIYHQWAVKITEGAFTSTGIYEMAPLPAYLWAFVYRIMTPDPVLIRWLNLFLGTVTCYFVYRIGKAMGGLGAGLAACLLAAVYQPFIFYSIVPLKTALAVFLFAATVCTLIEALDFERWYLFAICGVALGLLANVRPQALAILPVPMLFSGWLVLKGKWPANKGTARVLFFLMGFFLAISPFLIRNYRVAGELGLTVSQGGFNLYIGNHLESPEPYYRPVPFTSTSPAEQGIQFTIEASRRVGRKLTAQEASRFWIGEVLTTAAEKPAAFAKKFFLKVLAAVNRFEYGNNYHVEFISRFVDFFKIPLPGFGVVFPLAMAGFLLADRRFLKIQVSAAILFFYGATLVVFHCSTTYRLPLLVLLIPLAALGIRAAVHRYLADPRLRRLGPYLFSGLALFGGLTLLPVPGAGDLTAYHNLHAINLQSRGRDAEAVEFWQRSLEMNGAYSLFAACCLAGHLLQQGDIPQALNLLSRIPDDSYAAAVKHELIGDIMIRMGRIQKAVASLEKSLAINSGQRRVRAKLVRLCMHFDRARARIEMEKLRYIESFYNVF